MDGIARFASTVYNALGPFPPLGILALVALVALFLAIGMKLKG